MNEREAVLWLVAGCIIAVIDAWLSILSMFGILSPSNALSFAAAIIVGFSFTTIAVCAPIVIENTTAVTVQFAWFVIPLFDIGTSMLGAICMAC
jgi:hypothetical protein